MKSFKNSICILVMLVASGASSSAVILTRGPYLQSAGPDRMTVCWRTDEAATSEVATGPDTSTFGSPTVVSGTRTDHFVTLTGLQPATRYFYRISGTPLSATAPVNVSGPTYWFQTSPAVGTSAPMRMWVIGDSGSNPFYAPYLPFYAPSVALYQAYLDTTAAAGKSTNLWMMLGDNAYQYGSDSDYQSSVFDKYPALLRNTVMWSAFGNHDIASIPYPYTGPAPYDAIMAFPTSGECGGIPSNKERYYSFDRGDVHFISLDSTTASNVNSTVGSGGMMDWLINDLKATTAPWIITFFHHAPYSGGSHLSDTEAEMTKMRQNFVPILESYGVDLVLTGHSHVYERSGLIDGHYGISGTWNESMRKQAGNGSDVGGVNATGTFVVDPTAAQGAYQKPMATTRSGTVYIVDGSSGSLSNWNNISAALVNPNPYPAHVVSLRLMGGLVVETEDSKMNCQYLDQTGAVRDDFTILKGSSYSIEGAAPTTEGAQSGIAFPVIRTGALAYPEQIPIEFEEIFGGSVTPSSTTIDFTAGQRSAVVKFFPTDGNPGERFRVRLLSTSKTIMPGATPRPAYRVDSGWQYGQIETTPAGSWFASRFGFPPPNPEVWNNDDDNDGLTLLMEYALGGEPGRNDRSLAPTATMEPGGWIFRYNRAPGRSDLIYQPQGSTNLITWPMPVPVDQNDGPATLMGEPRRATFPPGDPRHFARLSVELTP